MEKKTFNLQEAAINFIHNTCVGLRHDSSKAEESEGKECTGKSLKLNQIPYNMEMDIDRLCLEKAVQRFLDSGVAIDAFDVYFCFMEMFVGNYEKTKEMVELLSEFEANGSSLLMKHRDHYSHSVYVFILGLAIYETNSIYREEYKKFYKNEVGSEDDRAIAHHFMKYWGLSALFHDIGYPMELPYEQMISYFEIGGSKRDELPFLAYNRLEKYTEITPELQRKIAIAYGKADAVFFNTNELFGYDIESKLGKTYFLKPESVKDILKDKPEHPESFNNFMDHAYFSATILFRRLYDELKCPITKSDIDAMTAIILHNSLYKFKIAFYKNNELNKPLEMNLHPLAYMLMLCDELQCWDRTPYGRQSRGEVHPMNCDFTFGENSINACFVYDNTDEKIIDFEKKIKEGINPGKMKAYSEMISYAGNVCPYLEDIENIINTDPLNLTVEKKTHAPERSRKHTYLSSSSFLNLYYFAVSLNGCYELAEEGEEGWENKITEKGLKNLKEEFVEKFNKLSLEYKLSNINQAKGFDGYLNAIGAFYSDRPVDYPILDAFTEDEEKIIGPMEHERWLREKIEMGWKYGNVTDENLSGPEKKAKRENLRIHPDMIPEDKWNGIELFSSEARANYERLPKSEQMKDLTPMNAMLLLLKLYGGARVYRLMDPMDIQIEKLAKAVHDSWIEQKKSQGFRFGEIIDRENKTDSRICPYEELSETEKDLDRATVRAVLKGLKNNMMR